MRVHAISGMHLADMSLVAYPTRNPSGTVAGGRGGEEDREKIYRIYHPDKTQGGKGLLHGAATAISRE